MPINRHIAKAEADLYASTLVDALKADGGIDYRMGFDEGTEDDIRLDCDGIPVVMAPEYVPLLDQATLDYVELEPGQFHFIFLNPKDSGFSPPTEG